MLMQRVITALIFALLVIALTLFAPGEWLAVAFALLVLAAAWEWSALAGLGTPAARGAYIVAIALAMALAALLLDPLAPAAHPALATLFALSALAWVLAALAVACYPRGAGLWGGGWTLRAIGFAVLVPPWLAALFLRSQMLGEYLVIAAIAIIAFADIGAYFAGRALGGPKLMPNVSPAKTWSGFCGGMAASGALALLIGLASGAQGTRLLGWLLASFAAALASVVGDLLESMVKRHGGTKDSGSLLPGHGGLFDRLDSLTAGLPVFALGVWWAGVA